MYKVLSILSGGLLLLYPFAIYFGLNYFSMDAVAAVILLLLCFRFIGLGSAASKMPWIRPASVLGAIAISLTFFSDNFIGFKLYPLTVNLTMFTVFLYSYIKPPSVIESFARISEPNLSDKGIAYTRKVTLVWCAFFVCNGLISLYSALFCTLEQWMLYNGFIAYLLMATLMAGEFLVRLKVKKNHLEVSVNHHDPKG